MSKSILKALALVRDGKPVDWPSTLHGLMRTGVDQQLVDKAVVVTAYGNKVYQVNIIDQAAFHEIEALASPIDKGSRSAASVSGNTHSTTVDGALLAVWTANSDQCINRIFKDGQLQPVPGRKHAFIIENEECFLNKENCYAFAKSHCGVTHPIEDIEFIYGSGNSISNRRVIPYLLAFEGEVLCLLDVDLGGLRIFLNLLSGGLDKSRTHYLVPDDIKERLKQSKRKASEEEREGLSALHGKDPRIDKLISAIRHFKTTIEQESYRANG